ncbi:hypothetical protein CR162_08870 [Pseudoroseomonas rhizosphaerae]|uniref:Uncharacterized protein n=1 Tax=Teichococcus rhizosphaerae TaxID=1335062 RepID=A0A2C6Y391_9PROT|nr:hypothetical protein [Pseudoroseomonas rhizosphaerae]PHK95272.1 hypothetical protein CR162_08870 [Pseudoroseomonas rhizosphaerae]
MSRQQDAQRRRVYAWEDRFVAPYGGGEIRFEAAQAMVDAIWADLGLRYPPKVERLPVQARRRMADADRIRLRMPDALPDWILLHELAHALSSTQEGASDGHGPRFLGLYARLLIRYLRIPEDILFRSLEEASLRFDPAARPAFLDHPPR